MMNENFDIPEKVSTPLLLVLLHFFDAVVCRVGRGIGNRAQCKMNDHVWETVPDHTFLKYCTRGCGATDDIRTNGIESLTEKERKKIARKLIRSARRETKRNERSARFQRWKERRDR